MSTRTDFWGSIWDKLSYNATGGGAIYNILEISGKGQKRLDGLQASWAPLTFTDDPATFRTARVVVAEGSWNSPNNFVDFDNNLDIGTYGFSKILLDLYTCESGHRVITLGQLGIIVEQDKTLSIVQFPMYKTGDASGQPSASFATVAIQGNTIYDWQNPGKQFKFKTR